MKVSQVRVGESYPYFAYPSSVGQRAEVLEVRVERQVGGSYVGRGRIYGQTTRRDGVRVQMTDRHSGRVFEMVVAAAKLGGRSEYFQTWAEYSLEREEIAASRARAAKRKRELQAQRAGEAARIERLLESHGVETRKRYALAEVVAPMQAVGFEFEESGWYESRFDADGYVYKGVLDEEVVRVLLAQAGA